MKYTPFFLVCLLVSHVLLADAPPKGWETHSPRDEIRAEFSFQVKCGGVFVIDAKGVLRGRSIDLETCEELARALIEAGG